VTCRIAEGKYDTRGARFEGKNGASEGKNEKSLQKSVFFRGKT
jgi:hypothetical protein